MMHPAASMVIYTTVWIAKVAGAAAFHACSANGADVRSVAVIQHLHAVTFTLNHNQMTRAVQRNTKMLAKSAVACAEDTQPRLLGGNWLQEPPLDFRHFLTKELGGVAQHTQHTYRFSICLLSII